VFKEGDIIHRPQQANLPTTIVIDGVRVKGITTKGDPWERKILLLRNLGNNEFVIKSLYPHGYFGIMSVSNLQEKGYTVIGTDMNAPRVYANEIEETLCQLST
jgi:hypothetical protein